MFYQRHVPYSQNVFITTALNITAQISQKNYGKYKIFAPAHEKFHVRGCSSQCDSQRLSISLWLAPWSNAAMTLYDSKNWVPKVPDSKLILGVLCLCIHPGLLMSLDHDWSFWFSISTEQCLGRFPLSLTNLQATITLAGHRIFRILTAHWSLMLSPWPCGKDKLR